MPAKPAILAVDDDPPVLRAVERDLRARYADDYRVIGAGSAADALEVVRELTQRDEPVALFLVDQRMPTMTGTEFLVEALPLQPDAKRVLLTAYADTDVAIRAINEIRLDQYLLKPWDPPEEKLYPVVDDLLADWVAGYRPAFEGLRLLSGRWAPRGHAIRDFLTRNQVPYTWLDPDADEDGRRLAAVARRAGRRRRVRSSSSPDGRSLRDPANRELADAIGMSTHAALPFYDLVIVGGGPAGLAAAVYGASEGLKTLMVEREAPGGQAGTTSRIENYLGFPSGLSGSDLARRALTQAQAPRCRDPVIAGGDDDSARGSVSVRRARRRHGGLLPGRDRDDRGELPAARGPGRGGARRRRRVLRRSDDRGEAVPGCGGRRGRRGQLGRPGRRPPRAIRPGGPPRHSRRRRVAAG